ncbi:ubiquitin protein ligase [Echinococcus multilocularis]|uniref:HECT-type E3 ubiquitin transferase n=1 Tax=Echinococcus multilocularis TaxID=6211 RepID=A0A068Y9K3_ECHMU|nr:ubiquitin protein ligase [Echinococcus multilocularis]
MYSFEGRFKARRQPPYVVEPKNLVQRMQEERRQRARVSRQERAAVTIQAFIRGTQSRRQTNAILSQRSNFLSDEIFSFAGDCSDDISCIQSVCMCLRTFAFVSKRCISDSLIIKVAHVLLTPTCTSLYSQWLIQSNMQNLSAITRIIIRFLSFLKNVPPTSPLQYYSPLMAVLKHYLLKQRLACTGQALNQLDRLFLSVCKVGHYFSSVAVFVDHQSCMPDHAHSFDAYIHLPENRDFLYLIRAPFSIYLSSKDALDRSQIAREFIAYAVADVADAARQQDARLDRSAGSKIPRFIFPLIIVSIPFNLLVNYLYACASGSADSGFEIPIEGRLQPSLDLLLPFLSGSLPRFLRKWRLGFGNLAIQVTRILTWMFSSLIAARCPADGSTTVFSPPFSPLPLFVESESSAEDVGLNSDSETNSVVMLPVALVETRPTDFSGKQEESDATVSRFTDTWPGQTAEVFDLLEKYLPLLAQAALKEGYETTSETLNGGKPKEVVDCLPVLYSLLAFFRPIAPRPMRILTSTVSKPPQFLHELWTLVTTMSTDNGKGRLFDIIASGTMTEIPRTMDKFTGVLLTFLNGLNHRLTLLTDAEVSAEPTDISGLNIYGFDPSGLLVVGLRLRDFMLGLIDLLYPPRPPARARPGGIYVPVTLREVIERVELQRMSEKGPSASGSSTTPSISASGELTDDEEERLRWCLHRWRTLFLATQKVVAQIYGWHRRQQQQQESWALSLEMAGSVESSEWLRPEVVPDFNNSRTATWMAERYMELKDKNLTRPHLGYFSCLNTNRTENKFASMTFMDWRRMTVILEVPFIFPFWDRVKFFVSMVRHFRLSIQGVPELNYISGVGRARTINIQVRRDHVYEDAFTSLSGSQVSSFHPRFMVTFYNEAGAMEMGIDGGGLCREMLLEVIRQGFDPSRGLFLCNDDHALYPNPDVGALMEDNEAHYTFLGAILSKAIYEGMVVDLQFAPFFLAKIISPNKSLSVDFNHLRSLDRELYRQLCRLKSYEGDVRDLELDFTIVQHVYGKNTVVELKPGGASIPVTNASRVEYINLVANYKLNKQILRQSMAFISGMASVLDLKWLQLFDPEELQIVISGTHTDIDVDDWIQNTQFVGDMTDEHNQKTINLFWAFVRDLAENQKRNLIRFVTASSRPPMFGFGFLHPPFTIQLTSDTSHYPTASTCMNLLKLPIYQTADELKEKFLYVIQANAGFEYS